MKSIEFVTEASIFDERTLKNTQWKSPNQTIRWLRKNGFKQIGRGWFAVVFAKAGHNRVVKISTAQDDCWIAFAQYAQTKTNNPHLPKIPWIKRYQGDRHGIAQEFFITIIERLDPLNDQTIPRITDKGVLFGIMLFANLDFSTVDSIEDAYNNQPGLSMANDPEIITKYRNHPFIKTVQEINRLPGDCTSDLHSGNLMIRKDGTVVITDPLANIR